MNYLVVAVLENFVAVNIFHVEMGVESKPLLVLPLVGYLGIRDEIPDFWLSSSRGDRTIREYSLGVS